MLWFWGGGRVDGLWFWGVIGVNMVVVLGKCAGWWYMRLWLRQQSEDVYSEECVFWGSICCGFGE
jgi:hypothetical protein